MTTLIAIIGIGIFCLLAEIMNLKVKALESLFQRAKNNLEILLNQKG